MSADRDADLDAAARARRAVAQVVDPEMPMLTLDDLGVVRGIEVREAGAVTVSITPTYSGCPAIDAMGEDIRARLAEAG
ncbi:MAG TPA: iron-sulfur cluster assembly protein, partial [Pseudonocardia sp.]|nr:iron-sulfur cluster assembly protein [Pseudonocardia sp.]